MSQVMLTQMKIMKVNLQGKEEIPTKNRGKKH
jgi:hypothetical protein